MTVALLFPDGDAFKGIDATDALSRLLGRFNPDNVIELRYKLAMRAGIINDPSKSDLEFCYDMDAAGAWTVQIINEDLIS